MRAAAFVDFRGISLDPAPDTTGVHWDAAFGHQLGHVFISQGVWEVPTDACTITSPGKWRPLKGLVGVIGMPFHGTRRRPPISQQNPRICSSASRIPQIVLDPTENRGVR